MWFDKDAPEEEVIPDGYNTLETFKKLLLVRYDTLKYYLNPFMTNSQWLMMPFTDSYYYCLVYFRNKNLTAPRKLI